MKKPNISKRLEKKLFLRGYQAFCNKLERNAITGSFKEQMSFLLDRSKFLNQGVSVNDDGRFSK